MTNTNLVLKYRERLCSEQLLTLGNHKVKNLSMWNNTWLVGFYKQILKKYIVKYIFAKRNA